jgi:hypothetical protein
MENQLLPISPCATQRDSASTDELIRVWLFRFGLNFEKDVVQLLPLWQEQLGAIEAETLVRLFERAMRTCKFFPKIADILEPVQRVKETGTAAAAEEEWQSVLDLRRRYWNPDMPGGFSRGMPRLSERVRRAANASGIFKLQDCESEAIHVWGRKRFVDSYIAWDELQQDQFLLPDGELKNLLTGVAETKALPAASVEWSELRRRGLQYAKSLKAPTGHVGAAHVEPIRETPAIADVESSQG